jgi:hypothetical protein
MKLNLNEDFMELGAGANANSNDDKSKVFTDNNGVNGMNNNGNKNGGQSYRKPMSFTGQLNLMTAEMDDSILIDAKAKLDELYSGLDIASRPDVYIISKKDFKNLFYSALAVVKKAGNRVFIYTILIEKTGRPSESVEKINSDLEQAMMNRSRVFSWTTGEAIEASLLNAVEQTVSKRGLLVPNENYISLDGVVVPSHTDTVGTNVMRMLGVNAYNIIIYTMDKLEGKVNDINIAEAMHPSNNNYLRVEMMNSPQTVYNTVGNPVRSDIQVALIEHKKNNNNFSINQECGETHLPRMDVFVDSLLTQHRADNGMVSERFVPNIVITQLKTGVESMPSTGNALLGIISTLVLNNNNTWMLGYAPNDYRPSNVGALNMKTNIDFLQAPIGDIKDLDAVSSNEVFDILTRMFLPTPVLSIDVEAYGPESHYQSIFSIAANNGNDKIAAAKEIIATAHNITNGNFDPNFDPNALFGQPTIIPMGYYTDKNGETRDIRDIDMAYIATKTQNIDLLNRWIMASAAGVDTYSTRISILNTFLGKAIITGKAERIPLSATFLQTLLNAAVNAGFVVSLDGDNPMQNDANYNPGMLNNYVHGLMMTTGTPNMLHMGNAQNQYNTNMVNMNYNRFY